MSAPRDSRTAVIEAARERAAASGHPNTNAAQRARITAALRVGPVSSVEMRERLDVLHPAGRVMELRRDGQPIELIWQDRPTACGRVHRVGVYFLRRGRTDTKD